MNIRKLPIYLIGLCEDINTVKSYLKTLKMIGLFHSLSLYLNMFGYRNIALQ
jgi:hypothetical protein